MRWHHWASVVGLCLCAPMVSAQEGRVFRKTPDTIGIWEFNDLPGASGDPLPNDTVIPDLSGNGLDARVLDNGGGSLVHGDGDDCFGENGSVRRAGAAGAARVSVDDPTPFEFGPDQDFTFELYVQRDEVFGAENWGILAGTWHSRTVLDDTADPVANGAWYGFGYIRHNEGGGWHFTTSPINEDRTFTPSFNEIASGTFEIPPGQHYLVTSVSREENIARVYLDGEWVAEVSLAPGVAFYTPTGYPPAYLTFLTGIDDESRGSYRTAPTGYAIDAARMLSRALDSEEVFDYYLGITDCEAVPVDLEGSTDAVVTATATNVIVDQCVRLSAANSSAADGETITKYEWKIGDGAFEEGEAVRELSFDTPSGAGGTPVTVRVTDSAGGTDETTVAINVSHPAPLAVIEPRVDGGVLSGSPILVALGDVLELDASASSTPIPATAFECPLEAAVPVEAPAITEYRWDLDSDGTVDETGATVTLDDLNAVETFQVTLTVANASGAESSAMVDVEVIEKPCVVEAPAGRVFLPTPETVGIWEFNDFDAALDEAIANDVVIEDLSGNGLDATVEANDNGELVVGEGDPRFDDNLTVRKSFGGNARVVVNDDDDEFEMDEFQDFSIELYVRRDEIVGGENWGILAGTWHSRSILDDANENPDTDGAWYGYGFIRNSDEGGWLFNMSPINPDGSYTPSFNEVKTPVFEIPAGSHYVVATVDRTFNQARVYLDGELKGSVGIPGGQAFITPPGHDHARMMFFAGEDDSTRGSYRPAPSGYAIDAARVMKKALTQEEIESNYRLLKVGVAVPPEPCGEGGGFVRGDADATGTINITDGVFVLNYLFTGGGDPPCKDAADADDSGIINITDGVYILNFLFTGGNDPASPYPECGADPGDDNLDCLDFPPCAGG